VSSFVEFGFSKRNFVGAGSYGTAGMVIPGRKIRLSSKIRIFFVLL